MWVTIAIVFTVHGSAWLVHGGPWPLAFLAVFVAMVRCHGRVRPLLSTAELAVMVSTNYLPWNWIDKKAKWLVSLPIAAIIYLQWIGTILEIFGKFNKTSIITVDIRRFERNLGLRRSKCGNSSPHIIVYGLVLLGNCTGNHWRCTQILEVSIVNVFPSANSGGMVFNVSSTSFSRVICLANRGERCSHWC